MGDVVKEMKGAGGVVVVGEGAVAVSGLRGVASARRRQGPRLPPLPLRHFAAMNTPSASLLLLEREVASLDAKVLECVILSLHCFHSLRVLTLTLMIAY